MSDHRQRNAALAGAGTTAAVGGVPSLYHYLKDQEDFDRVGTKRSFDDFLASLEPGDLLFHRHSYKDSPKASLGSRDLPFSESQAMTLAKGDPFYHSSVYNGKGITTEAHGLKEGVKRTSLRADRKNTPLDILAYRPKEKGEAKKALGYLDDMVGSEYPGIEGLYKNAITHLFGSGGPKASRCASGDPIACTELTANAYPKVSEKRYASPMEMRHSPQVELISRYNKAPKITALEGFLARIGYPVLKSLKYALPAAGAAYALSGDSDGT